MSSKGKIIFENIDLEGKFFKIFAVSLDRIDWEYNGNNHSHLEWMLRVVNAVRARLSEGATTDRIWFEVKKKDGSTSIVAQVEKAKDTGSFAEFIIDDGVLWKLESGKYIPVPAVSEEVTALLIKANRIRKKMKQVNVRGVYAS